MKWVALILTVLHLGWAAPVLADDPSVSDVEQEMNDVFNEEAGLYGAARVELDNLLASWESNADSDEVTNDGLDPVKAIVYEDADQTSDNTDSETDSEGDTVVKEIVITGPDGTSTYTFPETDTDLEGITIVTDNAEQDSEDTQIETTTDSEEESDSIEIVTNQDGEVIGIIQTESDGTINTYTYVETETETDGVTVITDETGNVTGIVVETHEDTSTDLDSVQTVILDPETGEATDPETGQTMVYIDGQYVSEPEESPWPSTIYFNEDGLATDENGIVLEGHPLNTIIPSDPEVDLTEITTSELDPEIIEIIEP